LKTRYSLLDIFAFVLIILSVILNAKKTKAS
ncbi:EamA/RhaT family transporter, partial [Campylobacter jejuni]|nr:EamA/RhaT family transporter [Campylobacter jejuni]